MLCTPPRNFAFSCRKVLCSPEKVSFRWQNGLRTSERLCVPSQNLFSFFASEHKVSQWNTKHFVKKMQSFSEERKTFVKERKSLDKYFFLHHVHLGALYTVTMSRFWESIPLTPTVGVGNRCQLPEEALHQL